MARITQQPIITIEATFTVNESELRALDALAGYGDDAFIEMFYKSLGKVYMQPHEKGLREFLLSIRTIAIPILAKTAAARKVFVGEVCCNGAMAHELNQLSKITEQKYCECPPGTDRCITQGGHFPACTACKRRIK